MLKFRAAYAYLLLAVVISSSAVVNLIVTAEWSVIRIRNETLHTLIEAVGAMSAFYMAVLLFQKRKEEYGGKLFLMSMGFLSMSILDGLHAVSIPGYGVVLLHSLSNIAGSIWFSLICFPGLASNRDAGWKKAAPWAVSTVTLLLGMWLLLGSRSLSAMVIHDESTTTAVVAYFLAGFLFTAAAVQLIVDYRRFKTPDLRLFIFIVALFASSCFSYFLSALWNLSWWIWHSLRLTAYFIALGFMIIDRWRAAELLRRSELQAKKSLAEVRTMYVTAPIGLCMVDADLRIVNISDRLSEMTGMTAEKVTGRTLKELFPQAAALLEQRFRSVFESGEPLERQEFHKAIPSRPDVERDWLVGYYPVKDDSGHVFGVYVVVQDITLSRLAEELESRLSSIIESSADAIFSKSLEGIVLTWNGGAEKIFGHGGADAIGRHISSLGIIDQSELTAIAARIRNGEHLVSYDCSSARKDGSQIMVSFTFSPIRDAKGSVKAVSIIGRDVTKQRETERTLQELIRQNRLIMESVQEGILGLDMNGYHTFINHSAAVMLGYEPEELIGMFSHSTWHHTRPDGSPYPAAECMILNTVRDGLPRRVDNEVFWRKGGTSFPVEYATTPVREGDTVVGTVVSFRDITERKKADDRLGKAISDLGRSNRDLEQFAYVASHDLQEPLRMISSFVQLLSERYKGKLDEKADQYIGFAVDGARRMQVLIEDLLAYSRVTRGIEFGPVDIGRVVAQVTSNLSASITESGASIIAGGLPTVQGDATRLLQLFQNLISNGLKFRRTEVLPEIRVSAERDGADWIFSVSDNGIGIEPEYFERIFVIFQRLHTREEYPGTGIGLTLCKKIVEVHHGHIWVESVPHEGTTFFFTIPADSARVENEKETV